MADEAKVKGIVEAVFKGLDETVSEYLVSVLSDDPHLGVSIYSNSAVYGVLWVGEWGFDRSTCMWGRVLSSSIISRRVDS